MASKLENLNAAIAAIDAKIGKLYHRRGELEEQVRRYRCELDSTPQRQHPIGQGLQARPVNTPPEADPLAGLKEALKDYPTTKVASTTGQQRSVTEMLRAHEERKLNRTSYFSD